MTSGEDNILPMEGIWKKKQKLNSDTESSKVEKQMNVIGYRMATAAES